MGILNVTPDSFYDRGRRRRRRGAGARRARWSRPVPASSTSAANRTRTGIRASRPAKSASASCRSSKRWSPTGSGSTRSRSTRSRPAVADAALAAGADAINDCSGLSDPRLAAVVARYDAALVVMHLKGELNVREPSRYPYDDALARDRRVPARARRSARSRPASRATRSSVDPGTRVRQRAGDRSRDTRTLRRAARARRIRFCWRASARASSGASSAGPRASCSCPRSRPRRSASRPGAAVLRVHDVAETVQLARMLAAVRGGTAARFASPSRCRRPPRRRRLPG